MTDDAPASFEDGVRQWLPEIDGHLEDLHVPLHNRVWEAATAFVTHCIEDIRGDTKEDFFVKPWFAAIYQTTEAWYQDKYGAALRAPKENLRAAVLLAGAIFRVEIPRTLSQVETEGETAWLIFPADIQADEDPLSWVATPPNFSAMSDQERGTITATIAELATCLRTAHVDLMTTSRPDPESHNLADKILPLLRSSADHLIDPHRRSLGLAAWDAHQAVESVLKLLRRQESGTHSKTHALSDLHGELSVAARSAINTTLIHSMPSKDRIIALRAGEGQVPSLRETYDIYLAATRLVPQCTGVSERKFRARNARLLLKKAPYIR